MLMQTQIETDEGYTSQDVENLGLDFFAMIESRLGVSRYEILQGLEKILAEFRKRENSEEVA